MFTSEPEQKVAPTRSIFPSSRTCDSDICLNDPNDDESDEDDRDGFSESCPPCEGEGDEGPCESSFSEYPVRFYNGEIKLVNKDLRSHGLVRWGHTRNYGNRVTVPGEGLNGNSWFIKEVSYVVEDGSGNIAVVGLINDPLWFDKSGSTYTGSYYIKETLTHDTTGKQFVLRDAQGQVIKYYDFDASHASAKRGQFKSFTDAAGDETTAGYGGNNQISDMVFPDTSSANSVGYYYDYYTSGTNQDRLQYVTLKNKVSNVTTNVRRAVYDYYDGTDSYGSAGDLKRARIQEWNGSSWTTIDTHYYRYYKSGDTDGVVNGLKYVVGPLGYAAMVAGGITPETATNSQIEQFAWHYFKYNSDRSVKNEIVNAGALDFGYTVTSTTVSNPSINDWLKKTVETLPDGNRRTTFTNVIGKVILKVLIRMSGGSETGDKWYDYYEYDDDGRVTLHASSAAVSSYSVADGGTGALTVNLHSDSGLIRVYDYYTTGAVGYLQYEKIKEGSSGTEIKLREYTYTEREVGSDSIYVLHKKICYPSDSDQLINIECTVHTYTWQGSTFQIDERTTTLPVVATTQNGSGTANSRKEKFNAYGQVMWVLDERGYIDGFTYDLVTGAMTQRVRDASSGTPWTPIVGITHLNLTTDYTVDSYGRRTQELGPTHSIDISGTNTSIRSALWTVYKDDDHEVWTGRGYQKTSDSSFTLIDPVTINRMDSAGRLLDLIISKRTTGSGKLSSSDTFAQTDWQRWTKNDYVASPGLGKSRIYFNIPSSGEGTVGTNYNETAMGYDIRRRRIRVVGPDGTIQRSVFNIMGWTTEVWMGTNDNGATDSDPSGGGATGNNMKKITAYEYDGNTTGGNGNVTKQTQWEDASTTRVTTYGFDFRNRMTSLDGEIDLYEAYTYDNQDRLTQTDQKDTTSGGSLVARTETKYDPLGRVYQKLKYSVSGGTAGNNLTDKIWYDESGRVIKEVTGGNRQFNKMEYDQVGRLAKTFKCFDTTEADTDYSGAESVTGNTVQEQVEYTHDDQGNIIQHVKRDRFHGSTATGTGELGDPSTQPKARVDYNALYPDALGRQQAQANYGTNGASSFTRATTIPSRSDTVLVTSTVYNDAGAMWKVTDPAGTEDRTEYDDAGRVTKTIKNYVDGTPSADTDKTTEFTYTADNQRKTLKAKNSVTGDQTTTWVYGSTLTESEVARNNLLRAIEYPDKASASDRVEYEYNRLGEITEIKDQIGTIHTLEYDTLGRLEHDRVTTLGSGVDGGVRRITRSYEVRGMLENLTSYDNATVGSGSVVNDVEHEYDGFGLLTKEYQSHSGAVNKSTSPKVQYAYTNGSDNHARRTSVTYPDGSAFDYDYGTTGAVDDVINRVDKIKDGSTVVASYAYLGQDHPVICEYADESSVELTYYTNGGSGDAGDQYTGLDRFGRVVDQRWVRSSTDKERVKYGYDRASNRVWRENTVATSNEDEYYTYDGLYQIKTLDRGDLNAGKTGISGTPVWEEDFDYDPTGNWRGTSSAYVTKVSGSTTLNQNRTHNDVNEITNITESTGTAWPTPTHDAAGNLTLVPRPLDLGNSFDLKYDAWNRLVEVKNTGGSVVSTYAYDGANRRTTKVYSSVTRHYYYSDQWQVLEERTDSNTTADRHFVWGLRSKDDLIFREYSSTRYYALSDALGSVTAIVNTSGDVMERYGYSAFGIPRYMDASFGSRSSSNYDWEVLFASYRYDLDSGMYQVRHRYLHPNLGRWISRDPIEYDDGVNLYAYVVNNTINRLDYLGLWWIVAYGRYCGPTRRAGCIAGTNTPSPTNLPPIDDLDAACERHDCCLATFSWRDLNPCHFTKCNLQLCLEAALANCANSPDPWGCRLARNQLLNVCRILYGPPGLPGTIIP